MTEAAAGAGERREPTQSSRGYGFTNRVQSPLAPAVAGRGHQLVLRPFPLLFIREL